MSLNKTSAARPHAKIKGASRAAEQGAAPLGYKQPPRSHARASWPGHRPRTLSVVAQCGVAGLVKAVRGVAVAVRSAASMRRCAHDDALTRGPTYKVRNMREGKKRPSCERGAAPRVAPSNFTFALPCPSNPRLKNLKVLSARLSNSKRHSSKTF